MQSKLWSYINDRFEDDGVLVSADEVYERFPEAENIIDDVIQRFAAIHDLTDIQIEYEGEIVCLTSCKK